MARYAEQRLTARRLARAYDTQLPRVQQYLQAELDFVKQALSPTDVVLELAAGYGRSMRQLAAGCRSIIGVDPAADNVRLGRSYLQDCHNAALTVMDARQLHFSAPFNVILCLQNALSTLPADAAVLRSVMEQLTPGGSAFFSTYSPQFWPQRLLWGAELADKGLRAPVDEQRSANGELVCRDGWRETSLSPDELRRLGRDSGYSFCLQEVDDSSLFLILRKEA